MRFGQVPRFAQGRRLIAKESRQRESPTKCSIQMALALHRPLRDLVQMPADSCHLELDFACVEEMVTVLTQSQQVCQRILPPCSRYMT